MEGISSLRKRIFIHFGPPKTGTSAIQKWMQNNRKNLLEQGILYPEHKVDRNGVSSGNLLAIYDRQGDSELTLNERRVKTLVAGFEASKAHTLVLSSEFFASRLAELAQVFPQAHFIGYVRNPLESLESHYNQSVKRHNNAKPIFLPKKLPMRPLQLLIADVEAVGKARFMLRAYSAERFPEGDICADFLLAIGYEGYVASPNVVNPSYSLEALELKRWLNKFELQHLNNSVDGLLQSFQGEITRYSCIPNATFEQYRQQAAEVLRDMDGAIEIEGAEVLIKSVEEKPQKPYMTQQLSPEQMSALVGFIRSEDGRLYKQLCSHIHQHSYLESYHSELRKVFTEAYPATKALPSRTDVVTEMLKEKIRALLGKNKSQDNPRLDLTGMGELRDKLKLGNEVSDGIVLRELALFAERNNQIEMAYCLMSRAQKLRPTGLMIRNKLEQLAKKLDQVER
ncbi:hypothetical protein [Ferrimonas balearica]|uniref:hypothetical protein n=1 Tax=Ferrimonas balearica TaxID=44012 RepID=UPI001C99F02A|nr:hypothetical protein [Ferrimonas balearica]MBY5921251.1 hypothetical protein [Ferrimonas balearica]MBY5996064.1 hypothetical protein [Ferrimonas balearica]